MNALNRTGHAVVIPGQRIVIPHRPLDMPHQPLGMPHQPLGMPDQPVVIPDLIRDSWIAGAETPDPIRGRNDNQGAVANGMRPGQARDDRQRAQPRTAGSCPQ